MLMRELRFDPIRNRRVIISTERTRRPGDYLIGDNGLNIGQEVIVSCPFCDGSEGKTPPEIFAIREPGSEPNSPGWKVRVVPNKYPALHLEGHAQRFATGISDVFSGARAHGIIPRLMTIAGFEWGAGLFINPTSPEAAADYLREEIEEIIEVCAYKDLDKNWNNRRCLDI